MNLAIAFGTFGLLLALAALLVFGDRGEGELIEDTLERLTRPGTEASLLRRARRREGRLVERLRERINLLQRLEELMWQAGLYMRVSEILMVDALLVGAGMAAGLAWMHDIAIALFCGVALGIVPFFYIRWRRSRRLKLFSNQLPEVLDLLKSSLEAGHSLARGLQVVLEEFPDPVSSEVRMVLEQTQLGLPLQRALEEMLKRMPDESLSFLVVAVKVQVVVGSSLADIIGRLADTVRSRHRVQLQIHALTAQSRLSGIIVGLLPVLVLAAFSVIQPNYASTLFHDPMGIKMLKAAMVLDVSAFLTIRYLLRLDY